MTPCSLVHWYQRFERSYCLHHHHHHHHRTATMRTTYETGSTNQGRAEPRSSGNLPTEWRDRTTQCTIHQLPTVHHRTLWIWPSLSHTPYSSTKTTGTEDRSKPIYQTTRFHIQKYNIFCCATRRHSDKMLLMYHDETFNHSISFNL